MDDSNDATHELLAHAAWLRRLARGLVRDASTADELVQRTWIAALERPPLTGPLLRGWLAAVLKNFARQDRRAGDRRVAREHDAARREALPAGDAQLEQLELQRRLMDAVLALPEPYRSVVVQRYYDELAPREIARRRNVPVKTVKTQLVRAQQKLREALDREHGSDRNAWLALVVPWISSERVAASTAGGVIVNAKLKLGIGVAIAAGTIAAVAHWWPPHPPELDGASSRANSSATLEAPNEIALAVELATAAPERVEAVAPASETAPSALPVVETPKPKVHGRVVDPDGNAVGHVDVRAYSGSPTDSRRAIGSVLARAGALGEFELDVAQSVQVDDDYWTTALAASVNEAEPGWLAVVVVAPKIAIHGRVVDGEGKPVAGAELSTSFDDSIRSRVGLVLDKSFEITPQTTSGDDGRFELPVVAAHAGALLARATGFELARVDLPQQSEFDLDIVLKRPGRAHAVVRGVVVEADGRPADGALVSHGAQIKTVGADGTFEFDFAHAVGEYYVQNESGAFAPPPYDWLCAVKAGRRPARAALPSRKELANGEHFFRLVLGEAPLEIRGRIVDATGDPATNAQLWLKDPTPFGSFVISQGAHRMGSKSSVEAALRGARMTDDYATHADGSFVLENLLDREYEIAVLDLVTLRSVVVPRVRAGTTGLVIRLAAEPPVQRVAGRVLSRGDAPIAGVHVMIGRRLAGETFVKWTVSVDTDAEGRFDFGALVGDDLHFQLSGENVMLAFDLEPPDGARLDDLELRASLRCHVRIDFGGRATDANAFSTIDEHGEERTMLYWRGASALVGERMAIADGRSDVVVVDEACREIVLYAQDKEIARVPLTLKPGELTIVRP